MLEYYLNPFECACYSVRPGEKKLIIRIRECLKEKMSDCLLAFVQVCGSPTFIPPTPFYVGVETKRRISKLKTERMQGKKMGGKSCFQRCEKERSYKKRGEGEKSREEVQKEW